MPSRNGRSNTLDDILKGPVGRRGGTHHPAQQFLIAVLEHVFEIGPLAHIQLIESTAHEGFEQQIQFQQTTTTGPLDTGLVLVFRCYVSVQQQSPD